MNKQIKSKVVAVIAARMGATRLPGKVLAPIMGKPLLSWMVERVKRCKLVDEVVVATSLKPQDQKVADLAKKLGIGWFRGSEADVLDRVVGAAEKYQGKIIVRLTADCPMVDPAHIDDGIKTLINGRYDYVANNHIRRTVPIGFDIEVCRIERLKTAIKNSREAAVHEHVTLFFRDHPEIFKLGVFGPKLTKWQLGLRLTVDTTRDLELVRRIFRLLAVYKPKFELGDVLKLMFLYPGLTKINLEVDQKPARMPAEKAGVIDKKTSGGEYEFKPRYRAAIIGLGRVASGYDCDPLFESGSSHAGAYQTDGRIQLIAACDIVEEAGKRFLERWGEVRVYSDMKKMFAQEKIDVVSITTRPQQHFEVALAAIEGGVKAIFCEKPFTDNLEKAVEIAERCKQQKIVLMIDYNRRFDRMHQVVKQAIKQEKLGQLVRGVMYYSNGFSNNGSHAIDLVRMFAGEVSGVQTLATRGGGGDPDVDLVLHLKSGGIMAMLAIDSRYHYEFEFDGQYQQGRIRILGGGDRAQLYRSNVHPQIRTIKQLPYQPNKQWSKSSVTTRPAAIATLVDILDKKGENPATGEDGIMIHKIIAAAKKSAEAGETVWLN